MKLRNVLLLAAGAAAFQFLTSSSDRIVGKVCPNRVKRVKTRIRRIGSDMRYDTQYTTTMSGIPYQAQVPVTSLWIVTEDKEAYLVDERFRHLLYPYEEGDEIDFTAIRKLGSDIYHIIEVHKESTHVQREPEESAQAGSSEAASPG